MQIHPLAERNGASGASSCMPPPERNRAREAPRAQSAAKALPAAGERGLEDGRDEDMIALLQLLPVSAWTLKPDGTPDFVNRVWLEFSGQTLDFVRSHPEAWMDAVHPDDRTTAARRFWDGVKGGQGFAFETRSLCARDGTYRWNLQQAVVQRDFEGNVLRFVGTTTDVDDQKRAEEALRQAQSHLAHVARVASLNAMTASIAHEIGQPLSGHLDQRQHGLAHAIGADARPRRPRRDRSADDPRRQPCFGHRHSTANHVRQGRRQV